MHIAASAQRRKASPTTGTDTAASNVERSAVSHHICNSYTLRHFLMSPVVTQPTTRSARAATAESTVTLTAASRKRSAARNSKENKRADVQGI